MPRQSVQLYEPEKRAPQPVSKPRSTGHKMDLSTLIMIILLMIVGLIALFSASYPTALYKYGKPLMLSLIHILRSHSRGCCLPYWYPACVWRCFITTCT